MARRVRTIRLNGTDYSVDSEEIRQRMRHIHPKEIDKYWVTIDRRPYPPKQVVAELLEMPLASFTTMDANRVLAAVGYKIESVEGKTPSVKTESEVLFEEYLLASGLTDFEFEPSIPGTAKKPDYLLRVQGMEVLFDVKEFRPNPEDFRPGGGVYNPYRYIREKIGAGRKKFKDLEQYCCCLVLHNNEKPLVGLGDWQIVMGAMLGNVGFSFPIDMRSGQGDVTKLERVFLEGGKMLSYSGSDPISPTNTTISAILVVERYRIGEKRFRLHVHEIEQELGRELTVVEYLDFAEKSAGTERDLSLTVLRIRVHENPGARIPLPTNLFTGPFDERYGLADGRIQRIFAGSRVMEFEGKSSVAKILSKS